jgi:hypothetical protein
MERCVAEQSKHKKTPEYYVKTSKMMNVKRRDHTQLRHLVEHLIVFSPNVTLAHVGRVAGQSKQT